MVRLTLALTLSSPTLAHAFCKPPAASRSSDWCHPQITDNALHFFDGSAIIGPAEMVRRYVLDPDHHGDGGWPNEPGGLWYSSDNHFDVCNFDGGVGQINDRYGLIMFDLSDLRTDGPRIVSALERLAHGFDLFDQGLSWWTPVPSGIHELRPGVLFGQGLLTGYGPVTEVTADPLISEIVADGSCHPDRDWRRWS